MKHPSSSAHRSDLPLHSNDRTTINTGSPGSPTDPLTVALITVSGLLFWFAIGFPFGNHNESYSWLVEFHAKTLPEFVGHRVHSLTSYRPLAQAVIWLGVWAGGGHSFLIQLFNAGFAVLAWIVAARAVDQKRLFAVTGLLAGGVLFSGYIYLFHLHGVTYAPLLLLIAWTIGVFTRRVRSARSLWLLLVVAAASSLFHPFAMLVFIAAAAGGAITAPGNVRRILLMVLGVAIPWSILLFSSTVAPPLTTWEIVDGWVTSFRMLEVNLLASVVVGVLSLLTAATLPLSIRARWISAGFVAVAGVGLMLTGMPLVPLWIAIVALKMALLQSWWALGLLASTVVIPIPGSGSPTYALFAVFGASVLMAVGGRSLEERIPFPSRRIVLLALAACVVLVLLLRSPFNVPVLGEIAGPILSEREKTLQLEQIIDWVQSSPYAYCNIRFGVDAGDPRVVANAVERKQRPPTASANLMEYIMFLRIRDGRTDRQPGDPTLVVWFGDDGTPMRHDLVYQLSNPHAGLVRVTLER